MAYLLKEIFEDAGFNFIAETHSNQLFPILPNWLVNEISQKYITSIWSKPDSEHTCIRFCTSWATKEEAIRSFIEDFTKIINQHNSCSSDWLTPEPYHLVSLCERTKSASAYEFFSYTLALFIPHVQLFATAWIKLCFFYCFFFLGFGTVVMGSKMAITALLRLALSMSKI